MSYFMIGNNDYSAYVNQLKVNNVANYNAQTNAAGNSVVEYINSKRTIDVGIIPLDDATMLALLADIDLFNVSVSFRNPRTNMLETINCIIPKNNIEYYTIQINNVLYNAMKLEFIEL